MVWSLRTASPSLWLCRRVLWCWLRVVCSASVVLGLLPVPLVADGSQTGQVHQSNRG